MTSPQDKVIDRESLKTGLVGRYEKQRAGGAFDVKSDLKTDGSNALSVGDNSSKDQLYTKTKGFKIKQGLMQSEFKEVDGGESKQLSLFVKGLNTKRYTDNLPR